MHIRAHDAAEAQEDRRHRAMAGSASRKFQFVFHPLVINPLRVVVLCRRWCRQAKAGIYILSGVIMQNHDEGTGGAYSKLGAYSRAPQLISLNFCDRRLGIFFRGKLGRIVRDQFEPEYATRPDGAFHTD